MSLCVLRKYVLFLDPYDAIDIGHNLALWKPTSQLSYNFPKVYSSSMAVDGDSTVFGSKAHTKTLPNDGDWWQVDLEAVYEIRVVVITRKIMLSYKCYFVNIMPRCQVGENYATLC